jgi:hypothetical protein
MEIRGDDPINIVVMGRNEHETTWSLTYRDMRDHDVGTLGAA